MMLLTFSCAAAYRRHVVASLALAVAEVGRDTARRADDDPRVQRLAWIDPAMIDASASGVVVVAVLTEDEAVLLDQLRRSAAA